MDDAMYSYAEQDTVLYKIKVQYTAAVQIIDMIKLKLIARLI